MKKLIKVICLILVCVLTCGTAACSNAPSDPGDNTGGLNPVNANHYANITDREDYLVKNGSTEYKIVLPANALSYEQKAATLINDYYKKAVGTTFDVITDAQVVDGGKYLSIGDTTLMRESGINVANDRFGRGGFRIVTQGDVIFISGARNIERKGTYYGAQEFLYRTINWRAYTDTEILYDLKSSIKMCDFDVVEIPDFNVRNIGYDITYFNNDYKDLVRYDAQARGSYTALNYYAHSHFEVLDPSIYCADHPEWYWYNGSYGGWTEENKSQFNRLGQLCLTNEEMTQAFIEELTYQFMAKPEANFVHLGIMDSTTFCGCDNCKTWMEEHGNTNSAGINVYFTNRVAKAVQENIYAVDPTRELQFQMFAYFATIAPPVKLVDGEYVADCEEVIPAENVTIQFTPLHSNGYETLDNIEKNQTRYEYFMGWKAITDRLSVWMYCINFAHYQISHKNWDTMAEDFRFYYENGVTNMYAQGPLTDSVLQMKEMRVWIGMKLMWNVNLSWQDLAEEFISVYYGDAAESIMLSYKIMTTHQEKLRTVDDAFQAGKVQVVDPENEDFWPFNYVEGQRAVLQQAFKDIEHLKAVNEEEYEKYYWRVAAIYFENIFLQMEYHMENYQKDYITEQIDLFEQIANKFNFVTIGEGGKDLQKEYIEKWRGSNV